MTLFSGSMFLNQLDRYILSQQIRPFFFFSLVLIGTLWLVQSLPRLDDIISNGQSAHTFVKVAFLMLPQVILLVIPLAAFSATLYSINQLFLDAEFVILMNTGKSNLAMARPVMVFGFLVTIFMYILSLYLVPLSQHNLKALMFEVRQSVTGQLVKGGRFFHPIDGISIYVREANKIGEMRGIFITDAREKEYNLTYSSREAILHDTQNELFLVMKDGLLQIASNNSAELTTVTFERLRLSLNDFFPDSVRNYFDPKELYPIQILNKKENLSGVNKGKINEYFAEAHLKIASPITPLALTLLALTVFLVSGYKRKGFSIPIYTALAIGITMQAATLSFRSVVAEDVSFYWAVYAPSIFVIVCCFLLLYWSQTFMFRENQ